MKEIKYLLQIKIMCKTKIETFMVNVARTERLGCNNDK